MKNTLNSKLSPEQTAERTSEDDRTAVPAWLQGTNVAVLKNVFCKRPQNEPIISILYKIRNGEWTQKVADLRKTRMLGEQEYSDAKKYLPAFMASMSSKGGSKAQDILSHSGLLQIDIDKLGADRAASARDQLGKDRHIVAAWISPSGEGVKALMRIPASGDDHEAAFLSAEKYVADRYNYTIDKSCKNVNRNCFVGADPHLVFNFAAEILPITASSGAIEKPQRRKTKPADAPLRSIAPTQSEGTDVQPWPKTSGLNKLYKVLVSERFGRPVQGERNTTIIEIAALLFYAVKPQFVFDFLRVYYSQHESAFRDYELNKVLSEARNLVKNAEIRFLNRLPPQVQKLYSELDDLQKAAFRICESLSKVETSDDSPPPKFHLSCKQLGTRLGIPDQQAHRIIKHLLEKQVIRMITKGDRYSSGTIAKASVYEWCLDIDQRN
jgi:hypothetical protein